MGSLALTAFGVACAGFAAAENLVKNPGFEEKDTKGNVVSWNDHRPTFRFVDGAGRNGTRGLAFDNANPKCYLLISQGVAAKPGLCYRYSAWIRTEKVSGSTEGAKICMEWSDRNGKWMGGTYAGLGKPDTKGEWQLLEGASDAIPANAAKVTFSLYADHNTVGKIWFDDVSVERYSPPVVSAMLLSGYRGVATGGTVRAYASLKLHESGINLEDADARFAITTDDGKIMIKSRPDALTESSAMWRVDTTPLAEGEYKVRFALREKSTGKVLGDAALRLLRVSKEPVRKETIDSHNRLLVNGTPFFPLGMYWSGVNKPDIDIFAKGPFNCLMPYGSCTTNQLDLCQANNLKVIYTIKDIFAGSTWSRVKKIEDEEPMIRGFVNAYRNHPALLGWYLNDELPLVPFRPQLEAHQRLLEDLDPDHPTWVVLYQDPDGYQQTFDVIGIDHYPVPKEPCGNMLKKTRLIARRTFGERPIWMVPQAMDWGVYHTGAGQKESRFPTLPEMRSMTWQCIAGGANGIILYSFFDLKKEKSHEPFAVTWPRTCAVGEEIRRYIPAMLSIAPTPEITHDGPEIPRHGLWNYNGELYILTVNSSDSPLTATLAFSKKIGKVKADFGPQPKSVDAKNHIRARGSRLSPAMFRMKE